MIWHWLVFFPKLQLGRFCILPQQNTKTTSSYQEFVIQIVPQECRSREKYNTTNSNIKEQIQYISGVVKSQDLDRKFRIQEG